jgi:hypothetical protein
MRCGWLCLCNDSFYVYTTVAPHGFDNFQHYLEARFLIGLWKPISPIDQSSAFVGTRSTTLISTPPSRYNIIPPHKKFYAQHFL